MDIVKLAADTAAFLRCLRDEGVPPSIAAQLAQTFLQSRMIGDIAREEPTKPWEDK